MTLGQTVAKGSWCERPGFSEELFLVRAGSGDGPLDLGDITDWAKHPDPRGRHKTNPGFSFGQNRETRRKFELQWRARPLVSSAVRWAYARRDKYRQGEREEPFRPLG